MEEDTRLYVCLRAVAHAFKHVVFLFKYMGGHWALQLIVQ